MAGSPLDSAIGIALQSAKGSVVSTASGFQYLLFTNGTIGPQELQSAFGRMAGSLRSLPRGAVKTGVYSGGGLSIEGAPSCLGWYLLGLLGQVSDPVANGTLYDHEFTFATDEFSIPYFTVRKRTAGLWHEQFQDCRIASLGMSVPATDMVRFDLGVIGLNPQKVLNTDWAPATYLDAGQPFLSCAATITSPAFGTFKLSNVNIVQTNAIALDEEWIVGSYYPDDLTLGGRAILIDSVIHATDEIFGAIMYDPSYYDGYTVEAAATWTPDILEDGTFDIQVDTQEDTPQSLKIEFDDSENIVWSAAPVVINGRLNKQLMRLTGLVKQSSGTQVKWTLTNDRATKYE